MIGGELSRGDRDTDRLRLRLGSSLAPRGERPQDLRGVVISLEDVLQQTGLRGDLAGAPCGRLPAVVRQGSDEPVNDLDSARRLRPDASRRVDAPEVWRDHGRCRVVIHGVEDHSVRRVTQCVSLRLGCRGVCDSGLKAGSGSRSRGLPDKRQLQTSVQKLLSLRRSDVLRVGRAVCEVAVRQLPDRAHAA